MVRLRLAEILAQRGMSWYELARASGLTETQVYRLAHGNGQFKRLGDDMLDRLCTALNVQPGDLLEWIPGGRVTRKDAKKRRRP